MWIALFKGLGWLLSPVGRIAAMIGMALIFIMSVYVKSRQAGKQAERSRAKAAREKAASQAKQIRDKTASQPVDTQRKELEKWER